MARGAAGLPAPPLQLQACILGGDDMAASLGATRRPDNAELAHVRGQFLLVCRALAVQAIDIVKVWVLCVVAVLAAAPARVVVGMRHLSRPALRKCCAC